jgi:hypothetical protein
MSLSIVGQLQAAIESRALVRLGRKFESGEIRGYVLDVGPEFFVIALVSDRIWFDGFECFRVSDIQSVEDDPFAEFVEAALAIRADARPEASPVDVSTIDDLILSAAAGFALVTIHKEAQDPDVCHIGKVLGIEGGVLWMLGIDPDATWEAEPLAHKLSEVTRVNFAGDYEIALDLVGGSPPPAVIPLRLVGGGR